MFSHSEFGSGTPPPPPTQWYQNRWIGALVLLICIVLLLLFAVGLDVTTVIPFNATHQGTLSSPRRTPIVPFRTPVPANGPHEVHLIIDGITREREI